MKIYANVWNSAKQKEEFSGYIDFTIETSFTPKDLWLVSIDNEGNFENKKIEKMVQMRKVQQILIGKVLYHNVEFSVQLALYCGGNEMRDVIIQGYSHDYGDYGLSSGDLFDLLSSSIHLFDFEELRTMPEYKDKSNIECIETFIDGHYPYNQILNCYEVSSGKIYSQIQFDNLG